MCPSAETRKSKTCNVRKTFFEDSLFAKNVKEEFKMKCDTFKGSKER